MFLEEGDFVLTKIKDVHTLCLRSLLVSIMSTIPLFTLFIIYSLKEDYRPIASLWLYLLCAALLLACLNSISLRLTRAFTKDSISKDCIKSIGNSDGSFLTTYLGYFWVALSIGDKIEVFLLVLLLLFIFTCLSQNVFYNPYFRLFGYRFYDVTKNNGEKIFIISCRNFESVSNNDFDNLRRINDYAYVDRSVEK